MTENPLPTMAFEQGDSERSLKILITMFYLFEQEYALLLMVILDTLLLAEASCAYDLRVKRPGIRALPSCLVFNTPSIQKNHNSFRG